MKKFILASLIFTGIFFSAFTGQNPRQAFSYEIFSAPYYKNLRENSIVSGKKVGFLPVMPDARACQKTAFSNPETKHFLQTVNLYLKDSLQLKAINIPFAKTDEAPDLFLGSVTTPCRPAYLNPEAVAATDAKAYTNRMAGQMPTRTWLKELVAEMEKNNLDYVVLPQIGEGYLYPVAKVKQRKSAAEVQQAPAFGFDLGTNFWLPVAQTKETAQTAAHVLFLKGLLINKEGKITRLGAEGITLASANQETAGLATSNPELTATDLNALETSLRRKDLPEQPLNWKIAAQNLVQHLTDTNVMKRKPTANLAVK